MFDYFASPFDVLFFRGNKSFSFGEWRPEGVFPPYPSTFQGFVRSKMLDDHGMLDEKGRLKNEYRDKAQDLVGTDDASKVDVIGPYLMESSKLQRTLFFRTPLDVQKAGSHFASIFRTIQKNYHLNSDLGFSLAMPDAVSNEKMEKIRPPEWINQIELSNYRMNLKDLNIDEKDLLFTEDRAGIGLDYQKLARGDRGTMEGRFYVTPFIRCNENIGFYFSSSEKLKPTAHKIGSESHPVCLAAIGTDQQNMLEQLSEQSRRHLVKAICRTRTFRLVLLQPGIFKDGWMPFPYEVQNDSLIATIPEIGLRLKLLFACLDLPLTISGYSFAANREKVRQETLSLKRQVKAIPAGSVYFFQMESETSESSIRDLVQRLDNKKIPYEPFSKIGFNHAILACGPEPVEPCN